MTYNVFGGTLSLTQSTVCLSDDNFRKPWRITSLAYPMYLRTIRVKFVYKGHRVKVKVTGPKKVHNRYTYTQRMPAWAGHSSSPRSVKTSSPITRRAGGKTPVPHGRGGSSMLRGLVLGMGKFSERVQMYDGCCSVR